jgi:hypothetical protein
VGFAAVLALTLPAWGCPAPRSAGGPAACARGETVRLGACVVPVARASCDRGRAWDLDGRTCATARDTRAAARAGGIFVGDEDLVVCDSPSDELVTRSGRVACVARPSSPPACPPGSVRDGRGEPPACAPLLADGVVDLARFARAAAAYVCEAIASEPAVNGRSEEAFEVVLALHAVDNDPTQASASARTDPPLPDVDLDGPVEDVLDALRRIPARTLSGADVSAVAACRRSWRRARGVGKQSAAVGGAGGPP